MEDPPGWKPPPWRNQDAAWGRPLLHETGIGLHRSPRNLRPASSIVQALFSSPLNFYLSSSSFRKTLSSFPAALAVSELEFQDPRPLRTGAQRKVFSSVRPRRQEVLGFPEGWGERGTPGFPQAAWEEPQLEADFSPLGSKGLDPAGEGRPTWNAEEFQGIPAPSVVRAPSSRGNV